MKIHISVCLDETESAVLANQLDVTLATVKDSEGHKHLLCAARGAITVPCAERPVTITPHAYGNPQAKKKKGFVESLLKG